MLTDIIKEKLSRQRISHTHTRSTSKYQYCPDYTTTHDRTLSSPMLEMVNRDENFGYLAKIKIYKEI